MRPSNRPTDTPRPNRPAHPLSIAAVIAAQVLQNHRVDSEHYSYAKSGLAGCIAGVGIGMVTMPTEVIKVQMQGSVGATTATATASPNSPPPNAKAGGSSARMVVHNNSLSCIRAIHRQHGLAGFYAGPDRAARRPARPVARGVASRRRASDFGHVCGTATVPGAAAAGGAAAN